ncbi:G-type lectin S-receptor-like serine/threonine-protein kinase LECRK2 isoform X2 [Prosopis cineraria]|uniref:G-type lectin S-receptor-like serine/threonine-protein kinase LECRK2 isoform X2 n=1 Tax=Prosopis cineraria TaxID=364024 RepID=UPI00240F815F|nr:G-type lectin S-receptor-like serine/threonine-protein kinase LECRK2 isoform X2 [Prosopis cineraria]
MAFEKLCLIFLLFLLLALLSHSVVSQSSKNISLGTSITAVEKGSFWASPSGEFAFGFQQIQKDGFLLAIWFNKIQEKTIVWSANGQNLAPNGSKVVLSTDGSFQLVDPTVGQGSQNWWQSFDHPTDTILPGQILHQPAQLVSHYLPNNYSKGRFLFALQDDGNFVLYTTNYPTDSVNYAYWTTQVFGSDFSVVFNQSGSIFVQRSNKSIIQTISSLKDISAQNFYQRAILDYDGVFRHYIYPKDSKYSTRNHPMAWSIQSVTPSNICLRISGPIGGGACGPNSYCNFDGKMKSCNCPAGYSFIDPNDVMKGCKQNFVLQSCDEASSQAHLFYFNEMLHIDWPNTDYEYFKPVSEDWCRQACLDDCLCGAASFNEGACSKKNLPLFNGRFDLSFQGKALIKVRKDNSSSLIPREINPKNDKSKLFISGLILMATSIFLWLLLIVAVYLVLYWFRRNNQKLPKSSQFGPIMNLKSFTYEELWEGTNGFSEELGRGAFSVVYKGVLPNHPKNLVAVKKLKLLNDSDKEFEAEVSAISQTHHRNLVKLLGFCNEGEHRLLVYEYMSKGTLANFLFEGQRLSWYQRVQIAIGTAKGLLYLHEECNTQIIHCDIKPQNVLLDDSYTAKISDFGLAKLLKIDQAVTTTAIRGTKGYVAAEWFKNKPITMKVDVYSFGVMLLELICCRKNYDSNVEDEIKMVLIDWACDCFHYRRFDLLVEDDKEALSDIERVEKYVRISIWCTQDDPLARPTMKQVVQTLEGFMDVPNPFVLQSVTS